MKFGERWLREWVDPPVDTDGLVAHLTASGLEVESTEPAAPPLDGVVVAEVVEVESHPDADRLSVCRVRAAAGADPVAVVCGAPNVFAGMRAPFAPPGTRLPGGVKIRKSRIRGVESNGMLCSAIEIGLGDDADGILSLDAHAPVGAPLVDHLGLVDTCIDINLTPNRGDCLSIAGLAREVAAGLGVEVSGPVLDSVPAASEDGFPVHLESPADCPAYVGRVIRDIDPGARTPVWMRERLRRCGLRDISPVVDVTNYVMLELGQPMHAFDLDTLDRAIRVRRARAGESLELLDGTRVEPDPDSLVIADESGPVALAGVMGGMASAVTGRTRHVFLESAWFHPRTIGVESRRRGLHTDSAHRFERGVAPGGQARAVERATRLLLDIVGGTPGPTVSSVDEAQMPRPAPIRLRASRITRLLGTAVPGAEVCAILARLGMAVTADPGAGEAGWQVVPPAHRPDVTIEADLVEEVARLVGYDRLPSRAPEAALDMAPRPESAIAIDEVRRALVHRGYHEAVTYSFVEPGLQRRFDPDEAALPLANPISADLSVMRTSLWPGLVRAVLHNANRQQDRVRLFETGLVFRPGGDGLAQVPRLGAAAYGLALPRQWGEPARAVDFFDAKADAEALLALSGCPGEFDFEAAERPGLHPGQSARLVRDGATVGWIGAIHPALGRDLRLASALYLLEIDLVAVSAGRVPRHRALSRHPSVRRDIAVIVDESVTAAALRDCVGQAGVEVLYNLECFDVYRGEGIDSGKKSLALGLTFQAPSRTLTDNEVDAAVAAIVDALRDRLEATLRG